MKKIAITLLVVLAAAATLAQTAKSRAVRKTTVAPPSLPYDVTVPIAYQGPISPTVQPLFDEFSWQTFIALNQPASGTSGPRIWETWSSIDDVFHPDAKSPCPSSANAAGMKTLVMDSKNEHVESDSDFLQATRQPLIDRNLNFVLYEIRMNDLEANYIKTPMTGQTLATYDGQVKFAAGRNKIQFPVSDASTSSVGAIEVKAAWRILGSTDDQTRYYTRMANIAIDGSRTVSGQPVCAQNVLVGLVGLHIVRKTSNFPTWIWSSFEQLDNVGNAGTVPPSFFSAACDTCPINTAPAKIGDEKTYLWNAMQPYAQRYATTYNGGQYGTQVIRAYEIYPFTEQVTLKYWNQPYMADTVWLNYQLIGSQWRAVGTDFPPTTEDVPPFLANTTMETYIQNQGSCLGCHENATANVPKLCSDFSFVFAAAHLTPTAPGTEPTFKINADSGCGSDTSFRARAVVTQKR